MGNHIDRGPDTDHPPHWLNHEVKESTRRVAEKETKGSLMRKVIQLHSSASYALDAHIWALAFHALYIRQAGL